VGPGANIEDGSSLIIHWSSGSQKRSTNWVNHINYNFCGGPYWTEIRAGFRGRSRGPPPKSGPDFSADDSILHMGRFRSSLGSESKKIILKLLDGEFSHAKIADIIGVSRPKSCISGFVKHYEISHYV